MARVLITYGTTDGQTEKIAAYLTEELRGLGLGVDLIRAGAALARAWSYDGVIVAASLHAGRYQRNVVRWARQNAAALGERPAVFVGVCLAVREQTARAGHDLDESVRRFVARTRWTPGEVKFVAGALKYTRYGWLKRRAMQRIVAKAGGDTDTSRDYEYTDWPDLRAFARRFAAGLQRPVTGVGDLSRRSALKPRVPEPAWAPRVMVGVL